MTRTTKELADRNAAMLRDPEVRPSVPLQDNTLEIQERFSEALTALCARIQSEVSDRYANHLKSLDAPRIEISTPRKNQRFIRIMQVHYVSQRRLGTFEHDHDHDHVEVVSRSRIVGFVEAGTGLLWKAATRKAPTLNYPRGCIFNLEAIPAGELASGSFDTLTTKIDLG